MSKRNQLSDAGGFSIEAFDHTGHRERLRTRFLAGGADALPDYEMLELVLFAAIPRRNVKPLAKALLGRVSAASPTSSRPRLNACCEMPRIGRRWSALPSSRSSRRRRSGSLGPVCSEKPALSSWTALIDYCAAAMGPPRNGAVPGALPGPQERPDRTTRCRAGHGRPRAGLSARVGQAGPGARRLGAHPGAQPPERRSDALAADSR